MYNVQYYKHNDYVVITIPEGKTMLVDGIEVPAPNWTTSIAVKDTASLLEYLTAEQIINLQEGTI